MSPDGKGLVLREADGKGTFDLTLLELKDGRRGQPPSSGTRPLVQSPFSESNAEISPDGRWLAYQSNSSGADEIYVRPFPETAGNQWRVSTAGGTEPLWSRDGSELFYRSALGAVMGVSVASTSAWTGSTPTQLLRASSYVLGGTASRRTYDVSLDGRRFLMIKNADAPARIETAPQIVVVQNWFEELKSRVPPK